MLPRSITSKWICAFVLMMATHATATVSRGTAEPLPSQTLSQGTEPCVWLIFLDDLHLDFTATGRLKDLLRTVFGQLVQEGDLVGVVSTGPSSTAIDLTRDRGRLAGALGKFSGAALRPSEILALPDRDSSEVRYRAHVTFDTGYGVLKMLARVPNAHKAVIYISNGYYFDVWPGSVRPGVANPFTLKGNEFSLERLRDEIAELTDQAKRANVPFYAIDPRGLSGPVTIDPKVDDAAWQKYWTTTRKSLHVIAEQTGGFVIEDDVEGNLKRVASAMR